MLSSRNQTVASERQSKFIQNRITIVEKHFAELCNAFAVYARKVARLRDAGDDVSKNLKLYSDNETVNKSLSSGLSDISATLYAIEEYRNARAQRLEVKVVGQLSQYEGICRHVRTEIKHTLSLRDNEISRKKALDRVKERNPLNRQQIIQAEAELLKASGDMSRTVKELEEQTDSFEKQKLQNMSTVLKNFIEIELAFHTKALELYTVAYRQINNIDNEADLYDYQTQLQMVDGQQSLQKKEGLGSIASLLGHQEKPPEKNSESKHSGTSSENSDDYSEDSS
ncbi:CBY1 interacting BAR domain containing protein Fam92 isoform X2 [Arctopsyche grandis]|uniref:CBY1 interacting BAR domain containing protein Fam92 isoform X2 n=1 Tax=Arctopsyche grandis TaxID=121162 RepID=UPI00406D6510